jgi:HD domain
MLSGSASEVVQMGALVAHTHHERWDGSGYPRGLAGNDIPAEGRIAAVADVFDAVTSNRVYPFAVPVKSAIEMMQKERGHHSSRICSTRSSPRREGSEPSVKPMPTERRDQDGRQHSHQRVLARVAGMCSSTSRPSCRAKEGLGRVSGASALRQCSRFSSVCSR